MVTTRISEEEREHRAYLAGLVRAATQKLRAKHTGYLEAPTASVPRLLNHLLECIEENASTHGIAAIRATKAAIEDWSSKLERPPGERGKKPTTVTDLEATVKQWGSRLAGRSIAVRVPTPDGDTTKALFQFSERQDVLFVEWEFPEEHYGGDPTPRTISTIDDVGQVPWFCGVVPIPAKPAAPRKPFDERPVAAVAEALLKVCQGYDAPP
ncbi:MAG: hypothetical protein NDJ92_16200, partial [Thermoanaerobaculia bacterium]|nr:hypothetical protein [Thermoanaerobaculia bacterium]